MKTFRRTGTHKREQGYYLVRMRFIQPCEGGSPTIGHASALRWGGWPARKAIGLSLYEQAIVHEAPMCFGSIQYVREFPEEFAYAEEATSNTGEIDWYEVWAISGCIGYKAFEGTHAECVSYCEQRHYTYNDHDVTVWKLEIRKA